MIFITFAREKASLLKRGYLRVINCKLQMKYLSDGTATKIVGTNDTDRWIFIDRYEVRIQKNELDMNRNCTWERKIALNSSITKSKIIVMQLLV